MFPKGLKSGIIVNLVMLIAVAMILVDLVMIGSMRQEFLNARLNTALSFMALSGPVLAGSTSNKVPQDFMQAMNETEATCLMVISEDGEILRVVGNDCKAQSRMLRKAGHSLITGETDSAFYGNSGGIFFPERKNLVVSYPFKTPDGVRKSAAIQLSLKSYYEALRNSQRVFFLYFLVNLLVISLLGFYRLYLSLVKPINNLVSTAEEFTDDGDFSFSLSTNESEFNLLSRSLNKMLSRINEDRFKLEKSVQSLEKTNTELQLAQKEVVRAEKFASVGRLSAGIAHEIGNPLGIVLGYLDLLRQENISVDQKKDFLARTEDEVNRINTIIRQLLDFARHPQDDHSELIEVHAVINDMEEVFKVQPLMAGISITTKLLASNDQVLATTSQLKQIFMNLLINGADAINSNDANNDGRITITTEDSMLDIDNKASVSIIFADNGPGIDPDQLQNMFDPFYTTKEPGKGTGLGLSICFTMVESLGGTIKADMGIDGGMVITIQLPVAGEDVSSDLES